MQQNTYMYGPWGQLEEFAETTEVVGVVPDHDLGKQSKADSLMESVCNIFVGFIISWAVWVWIVAPLFGFHNGAGTSFLVTCIFTVTSLIRQYVLRRAFNGRTIWETIRAKAA